MTSRGSMGRLPKATGSMPVDWEDKYRRLHAQHGELKGIYATMQDHNKKLQTKIRKLEADYVSLRGGAPPSSGTAPPKEDEELVSKLYAENTKLKSINKSIKEKYNALESQLEKKKREVAMLSRKVKTATGEAAATKGMMVSASQEIDIRPGETIKRPASAKSSAGKSPEPLSLAAADNSNLLEVARKYKTRYVFTLSVFSFHLFIVHPMHASNTKCLPPVRNSLIHLSHSSQLLQTGRSRGDDRTTSR